MSISQNLISALLPHLLPSNGTERDSNGEERMVVDPERTAAEPPAYVRALAKISREEVAGRQVLRVRPRRSSAGTKVIYWHGGAWVNPMLTAQWLMVGELVRRSGAEIWVPSYPLAPEHSVDDSFSLIDDLYDHVRGLDNRRFVLVGDSAGGAMSLLQAVRVRDRGLPQPDHLVLYAPAPDVRFGSEEAVKIQAIDPALTIPPIQWAGRAWAGDRELDDPMVSPGLGDVSGLAPTAIFQGTRDLLAPDNRALVKRMRAAGGSVEYHEVEGGFHVYQGAIVTPEARDALARTAQIIRGPA